MSTSAIVPSSSTGAIGRRVRAYFAPVDRNAEAGTIFDASLAAAFNAQNPLRPWIDLGWIDGFARKSDAKIVGISSGAPSAVQYQVRQTAGATVSFSFQQWSKLTMALAGGTEHMNVLVPAAGAAANGSGGIAGNAHSILFNTAVPTTAVTLALSAGDLASYSAGSLVCVDIDYASQTGFVGAGISAAYVKSAASVNSDPDYVRRLTFNVALVQQVTTGALLLAQPLPAGTPTAGMKVQPMTGFVDREGGMFLQEWSALFVITGEQGDSIFFHYPRLQAMQGPSEMSSTMVKPLERISLGASFRALPVVDLIDGQEVFCFRTYVPAPNATV